MNEVGEIIHLARSGRLILKLNEKNNDKNLNKSGEILIDSNGKKIGRIVELIGSVKSPFASVEISNSKAKFLEGTKVFAIERQTQKDRFLTKNFSRKSIKRNRK